MKPLFLAFLTLLLAASAHEASIPYFSRTRSVTIAAPGKQNYIAIDSDVWKYARPDLSDLRLYDGRTQVPYVLARQSGGSRTQESQAKILNLGTVSGHTEFDLDARGFETYDRVRLQLTAKNFINRAQVEGRHALNDRFGTNLGASTLYDFTKEGLGSSFVLKFPAASFPYLHVRLAPGIRPDQLQDAYLSSFSETRAAWTNAGQCSPVSGPPRQSVFHCSIADGMPLERISFTLPPDVVNFNRTVLLTDEHGNEIQSGAISRVRINRAGQLVTSEELAIEVVYPQTTKQVQVAVQNGDDPPLPIAAVQPLSMERRLYFDPKGKTSLQLYYGDSQLESPTYDYAKFFQQAADAAVAQLGPANANPQFTGRPDDRPWSERHTYVLWGAMLLAVIVLGVLAVRGLKASSSEPVSK